MDQVASALADDAMKQVAVYMEKIPVIEAAGEEVDGPPSQLMKLT